VKFPSRVCGRFLLRVCKRFILRSEVWKVGRACSSLPFIRGITESQSRRPSPSCRWSPCYEVVIYTRGSYCSRHVEGPTTEVHLLRGRHLRRRGPTDCWSCLWPCRVVVIYIAGVQPLKFTCFVVVIYVAGVPLLELPATLLHGRHLCCKGPAAGVHLLCGRHPHHQDPAGQNAEVWEQVSGQHPGVSRSRRFGYFIWPTLS
jgi:hypothetical protein